MNMSQFRNREEAKAAFMRANFCPTPRETRDRQIERVSRWLIVACVIMVLICFLSDSDLILLWVVLYFALLVPASFIGNSYSEKLETQQRRFDTWYNTARRLSLSIEACERLGVLLKKVEANWHTDWTYNQIERAAKESLRYNALKRYNKGLRNHKMNAIMANHPLSLQELEELRTIFERDELEAHSFRLEYLMLSDGASKSAQPAP